MSPSKSPPKGGRKATHTHKLHEKIAAGEVPTAVSERTHQEWVPVAALMVDRRYQRAVTQARVTRMAVNFDPDALGTVTVSKRDDGTLYLLDGQHRTEALKAMGWDDQLIPALVYTGLTLTEEARIFRLMNAEAASPTAYDIFAARITEGDPDVKAMLDILTSLGLKFDRGPGPGHISAVAAIERVFRAGGPTTLLYTLRTMRDAWRDVDPYTQAVYPSQVIVGIGVIFARYGRHVDQRRMIQVLGRSWSPSTLVRDCRAAAKSLQASNISFTILPHLVVTKYNQRIDVTRHLPTWEFRQHSTEAWAPVHGAWETDGSKKVMK